MHGEMNKSVLKSQKNTKRFNSHSISS